MNARLELALANGRYRDERMARYAAERRSEPLDWWESCLVTRMYDLEPTVHLHDVYAESSWTVCGKQRKGYMTGELPLRHACKIGRPCRRCFPDGFPDE